MTAEPSGRRQDRRDGSPDLAWLVSSLQRSRAEGLKDAWYGGSRAAAFTKATNQLAELAEICRNRSQPAVDGVVRWRRVDLQKDYHERHGSESSEEAGLLCGARPRHPAQDAEIVEALKTYAPPVTQEDYF
ncbi:hypothetical protein [Mesorhizobium waimense]|uniref:hypothetical protein n=1 Tax=Mesorhizobium waimense TaxID=1300307 RepID=UPI0011C44AC6